ncbi:MAG: hypothetical protein PVF51_00945 [Nitrospirota bacterium]|jgi:hypothetical protein
MKTTWTKRFLAGMGTAAVVLTLAPATGWAADYSSYSTDELMALRGTLRDAPAEEREQFRTEVQKRIQEMSPEELAAYGFGPRAGMGSGAIDRTGSGGGPRGADETLDDLGPGYGDGTRPRSLDGTGLGPGDGTRPRPMDGTGFGAGSGGHGGGRGGGPRR